MRTLRLIGRGASDTFEHLMPFAALSLGWWVCVALILPAPGATVALAALTDPRRSVDRPDWREAAATVRAHLLRGWGIALLTLPFLAVLAANLASYAGGSSRWALLVPLWTLLFVTALAVLLGAVSIAGLLNSSAVDSVKLAFFVALRRPFRTLAILLVLAFVVLLGTLLVVPLVMLVPALVAAVVNRFVLDTLGIPVPDPLAPTPEREEEERRRASASRFGP
jgi:uncharacterized membrane protein YesL